MSTKMLVLLKIWEIPGLSGTSLDFCPESRDEQNGREMDTLVMYMLTSMPYNSNNALAGFV